MSSFVSYDDDVSQDIVSCQIIAISVRENRAYRLQAIESFSTSKSEQSEPGTFTFSGPLTEPSNLAYLQVAAPMDIIAIYARRVSDEDYPTFVPKSPVGPNASVSVDSLTYGGGEPGSMARSLQSDTLIFLGVVDDPAESYQVSESPTSTLTVSGQDFTKFLNCSDVVIPYTTAQTQVYLQGALLLKTSTDMSYFMKNFLDIYVSKTAIEQVIGPQKPEVLEAEKALALPWRNFISTAASDAAGPYTLFDAAAEKNIPNFQTQSGSAWANLITLKCEPLSRLFITEDGEFLVDDFLRAVAEQGAILFRIGPNEVLGASFSQDDANVATFISVYGAQTQVGSYQSFFGGLIDSGGNIYAKGFGIPEVFAPDADGVPKLGVRQAQYQSTFDTFIPNGAGPDLSRSVRARIFATIRLIHNALDVLTLTVRGRSLYRVGTRITVAISFARQSVSNATWYVCSVSHQFTFGQGWTCTLQLRFPQAQGASFKESEFFS